MFVDESLQYTESVAIPFVILESPVLTRKAKLLFAYLRAFDSLDSGFPTFEALEKLTGFGHSTLSRAIKELKNAGIIEVTRNPKFNPRRRNFYTIQDPRKWKVT